MMTEFITRNHGQKEFEVIIKTDNKDHYKATEDFARKLIDHAKPQTNADRIRAMSEEELAAWIVEKTVYQESAFSSPSYLNFLTQRDDTKESAINGTVKWLKQPADIGGNS